MALDTDKIPQGVLIAIAQAMGYDENETEKPIEYRARFMEQIANLSWKGAFALWCQWHGFLGGWEDQFTSVISDLQDADVRFKKPVALSMTFDDLRRNGKSISPSMEHIEMTMGSLHAGSTFPGKIYLDADSREFFQRMMDADLQVVFWVGKDPPLPDRFVSAPYPVHEADTHEPIEGALVRIFDNANGEGYPAFEGTTGPDGYARDREGNHPHLQPGRTYYPSVHKTGYGIVTTPYVLPMEKNKHGKR